MSYGTVALASLESTMCTTVLNAHHSPIFASSRLVTSSPPSPPSSFAHPLKVPRSMRSGPLDLTIRRIGYKVDIDAMTQTNTDSGNSRTIRRRVLSPAGGASAAASGDSSSGKVASGPLVVGDIVHVRPSVSAPKHGWGTVKPSEVGVLHSIDGTGGCQVNFPSMSGWSGVRRFTFLLFPCNIC